MLVQRGLNDRVLHHDVPDRVQQRLAITREELEKQLEGTASERVRTWGKDLAHSFGGYLK